MKDMHEQERTKTTKKRQVSEGSMDAKEPIESVEEAYGVEDDEHYAGQDEGGSAGRVSPLISINITLDYPCSYIDYIFYLEKTKKLVRFF